MTLQPPFEIYRDGTDIGDANGHVCTAENPEIAKAILNALQAAPTGDSAEKLAAAIAHKVLDYLNSAPVDEDEEHDDWCIVRDIARDVIASALRQPSQPMGDVGEELSDKERTSIEYFRYALKASREGGGVWLNSGADTRMETVLAVVDRLNSRSMLPAKDVCVDREVLNHTLEVGKREITALRKALRTAREAHKENARLLGLVGHGLQGRIDASKLGAIFQCAERSRAALTGAGEEGP